MSVTAVRQLLVGEKAHHPSVLNRPVQDLLTGSGYAADGSDFAGFATVAMATANANAVTAAITTAASDATAKVAAEATLRANADTAAIATAASDATTKVAAEATARGTADAAFRDLDVMTVASAGELAAASLTRIFTSGVSRSLRLDRLAGFGARLFGYYVSTDPLYAAPIDGTTDARSALNTAATAAGTTGVLVLAPGTYAVASNLTIACAVLVLPGAVLKPASGVVVTLTGAVTAPATKIVDSSASGSISFTGNRAIREYLPQWWGVVGDGVTDDQPALTTMLAAIPDYAIIRPSSLNMALGSTWVWTNRTGIIFDTGRRANVSSGTQIATFTWIGAAGGTMVQLNRCRYNRVAGIGFKYGATATGPNVMLDCDGFSTGQIGTDNEILYNDFECTTSNAAFVAVQISKTAVNNHEYYKVRSNRFVGSNVAATKLNVVSITAAATTLTGTGFTSAMAGKVIRITGAGAAGVMLETTVASFTDSTHLEISIAASTTVSGVHAIVGKATGVGLLIGASFNSKRHVISDNYFLQCGVGLWAKNGSHFASGNSYTSNDRDIEIDSASEPCYHVEGNSEHSVQHLYSTCAMPVEIVSSRFAPDTTLPGGAYMEFGAATGPMTVASCHWDQAFPVGALAYGFANATGLQFTGRANKYTSVTRAILGYDLSSATVPVKSQDETGISDMIRTDQRTNSHLSISCADSQNFTAVSGTATTIGATPTVKGVRGVANPGAGTGAGTTLVGVEGAVCDATVLAATHTISVQGLGPSFSGTGAITDHAALQAESPALSGVGALTTSVGVRIKAQKTTGVVTGLGISQEGASDKNKLAGRTYQATPATAPTDADLTTTPLAGVGAITFYLDEAGNNLKVRVVYANGTTFKTATVALV